MSFLMFVHVLLPTPLATRFTYRVGEESVVLGSFVRVPFGSRHLWGVVWEMDVTPPAHVETIKIIAEVSTLIPMSAAMRKFISWVAEYTLSPEGMVLKMALSVPKAFEEVTREKRRKASAALRLSAAPKELEEPLPHQMSCATLSETQQLAATALREKIAENVFSVTVLEGVTGSGKTEVYADSIAAVLAHGKQALVLLPEIVLTTQMLERIQARLGVEPLAWHSHITPAQKAVAFRHIASGEARLVVGARSALFLPFKQLGLIVVDEEHDPSYKQEEGICYHARDMAVARGSFEQILVILATATPALETIANVERHKYDRIQLLSRYGGATMPSVHHIDMRQEGLPANRWISYTLKQAIEETLAAHQQVILFLNRKGYAPLTLCRHCGHRFACPDCAAWLVEHKARNLRCCHHCGYQEPLVTVCPACAQADQLVACGPGVERVAEEAAQLFPGARIKELTSDVITSPKLAAEFMRAMEAQEIDIIVGTQIIAKGHHFPMLTLVGVIDADIGLAGGDLRAAERTYQLLHQVSGRAGRAENAGRVYLQTVMPESSVMRALSADRREMFLACELESRHNAAMPPFGHLVALILSGANEARVAEVAKNLARKLFSTAPREAMILGPVPAPLTKLRGKFRYRILIKTPRTLRPQGFLKRALAAFSCPPSVRLKVDVDPYSFL